MLKKNSQSKILVSEPELDFSRPRLLIGAIFVQAAIRGGLEICAVQMRNDGVPVHLHTNCTALHSEKEEKLAEISQQSATLMTCISSSGSVIKNAFDQTLE